MDANSKAARIIVTLYLDGWRVTDEGVVGKPNGTTRRAVVKKMNSRRTEYEVFSVKFEGSSYPIPVHKLAAFQKFGFRIFVADCIRHLDGNPLNNAVSNLGLGSHRENAMDRPRKERELHARKAAEVLRLFSPCTVITIRNSQESVTQLAKRYGCAKSTISYLRRSVTYAQ